MIYTLGISLVTLALSLAPVSLYAESSSSDQNAQVTLGGAKTFVTGEIQNIAGDHYFVRDEESGGEVRLLVNKDTNMDCSAATTQSQGTTGRDAISKRQSTMEQSPGATDRQREQGQKEDETAIGSGFRIGTCSFNRGDRIKAEVDDNGRVTTIKSLTDPKSTKSQMARPLGESSGTGELAIPGKQTMPGQLDMTTSEGYPQKQYAILPVPLGEFKVSNEESIRRGPVKGSDGKMLGSLETMIVDSDTGKVEYAVVRLNDSGELQAVPWSYFSMKGAGDKKELVLNTKEYQLFPELRGKDFKDQSPAIDKLIKEMQTAKAAPDLRDDNARQSTSRKLQIPKDVQGTVVRGRIKKIEGAAGDSFLVKDSGGKEIRMRVDGQTMKATSNTRDESFKEGDKIEAYVTPDGHAFSISLMRPQGAMPNDPEAGG